MEVIVSQYEEDVPSSQVNTNCISDLPDGIKTHFVQVCTPNQKGQARYRCLKCSHEFECSGRNRLIHHVAGISPNGSPTRHVKACPNPHRPLQDSLIEKIRREQPEKLLQQSLLRKRKEEKAIQLLSAQLLSDFHATFTSGESSPLNGSDSSSESQDDVPSKRRKVVPAVSDFASPLLVSSLQSYPKERLLAIIDFIQIISPQPLQLALFLQSTLSDISPSAKYIFLRNRGRHICIKIYTYA